MLKVDFKKLRDVKTPSRSYSEAAGFDFYIPDDIGWDYCKLLPQSQIKIPCGLLIGIPQGFALRFDNKSGMATKGLIVGASICDADYQGEIHLHVWNVSPNEIVLQKGQKLLQGIFFETHKIELNEITTSPFTAPSDRGEKGFGSTDNS